MNLLGSLPSFFDSKPLVLLRFGDGYAEALRGTRHGVSRFTEIAGHEQLRGVKAPTLCLTEMREGDSSDVCVGVIRSKAAVATFDSRICVVGLRRLNVASLSALAGMLHEKRFRTLLAQRLAGVGLATVLSPKMSMSVIEALIQDPQNRVAIEAVSAHIPRLRHDPGPRWAQLDAIKASLVAFGLSKSDSPVRLELADGSDSMLAVLDLNPNDLAADSATATVLEDNVIARDASEIPGFELIKKYVTGRAVFLNRGEQLDVYTANKGPLEEMLGVDLVYVNGVAGSMVMVQYKMLNREQSANFEKTDWVFRPDDQFHLEVDRMKLLPVKGRMDDYRMHRSPFFFKFVQRAGDGDSHASFVVSLDHLSQLLDSPLGKGPKGGLRVSFEVLGGVYLRESDLLGLIRSGYVGTHRIETAVLEPFVREVSNGNRSLVVAWRKAVEDLPHPQPKPSSEPSLGG